MLCRRQGCRLGVTCGGLTAAATQKAAGGGGQQRFKATRTTPERPAAGPALLRPDRVEAERPFQQRLAVPQDELLPAPSFPTSCQASMKTEMSRQPSCTTAVHARDDVRFHRRLGGRFTSLCDQEKFYGTAEVAFHTIYQDIQLRLHWAREALRLLQEALPQASYGPTPVPRRLVVLVLYSHTQHNAAVGLYMRRISSQVRAMLAENHEEVLGVLTAVVGVKWRSLTTAEANGMGQKNNSDAAALHDDFLWYPNAGLYTFNAMIQCLCRVGLDADTQGKARASLQLHRKILTISEGWFHVRTAAELHQPPRAPYGAAVDTVDVEPLPFVLGSAHTAEELHQFARYTACRALAL
ncbi:hypothetical protein TraAM80_02775 [Trypanosoma rangeli]|uniref:Uncharacterized protein n=1 Tax=Trypanosoma rangeli TaxID=5698 RepID=A0A3S5IRS5_TRYRA|nr:uncharacterized protein TraAM80_02775 [Trypanosoma rangeli]RNF08538.1 hypothetical protein TraAM80_02775 [Trypanosoma rangeli]|eukprot:RNF08538.1 hypothetical protein TraAM80_02775 [Trypanosoma rangeli]